MAEQVARTAAREWWKRHITGEEVDYKALARKAAKELGGDPDFRQAFVDDFLESAMYEMGQRLVAIHRAEQRTTSTLRKLVEEDAKRDADKWEKWYYWVPETMTSIALPNMTREQVLSVAAAYIERAESNMAEAKWLKIVANKLRPGQQVGDVLTQDAVQELRKPLRQAVRKVA